MQLLAYYCSLAGQHNDAIHWYEVSLTHSPGSPVIYNNLGFSYRQQNRYDLARAKLNIATRLRSDFSEAWHNLAIVELELAKKDNRCPLEAIAAITRAVETGDTNHRMLRDAALIYVEAGKFDAKYEVNGQLLPYSGSCTRRKLVRVAEASGVVSLCDGNLAYKTEAAVADQRSCRKYSWCRSVPDFVQNVGLRVSRAPSIADWTHPATYSSLATATQILRCAGEYSPSRRRRSASAGICCPTLAHASLLNRRHRKHLTRGGLGGPRWRRRRHHSSNYAIHSRCGYRSGSAPKDSTHVVTEFILHVIYGRTIAGLCSLTQNLNRFFSLVHH